LSMADVGMVTAAGNKMTIAMGQGDAKQANRIFHSAQLFMALVCSGAALVVLPLTIWAPLPGLVSADQRMALAALSLSVIVSLFGGLSEAVFKSTNRYATGTMVGNITRLLEWAGCMAGLAWGGSFAAVALGGLLARVLFVLIGMALATRGTHGMHWGVGNADRSEIGAMVKPAVSFMAFPLANALSFQGVTLVVAALFGPATVAIFNTYRTIARVAVQVSALFSHALWPEFSRLYGQGNLQLLRKLYQRSALLGLVQPALLSMCLYFAAPWLLQVWTHGAIAYEAPLMLLMLVYAAVAGVWHVPRVLLMATNLHTGLALWAVLGGALSVALAWLLGSATDIGGVAKGMLVSELLMAGSCVVLTRKLLPLNRATALAAP
jgi:O-antigen/teichoic acid export membrane protein